MITELSEDRLKELLDREKQFLALDSGGVESWDGYYAALERYRYNKRREEKIDASYIDMLGFLMQEMLQHVYPIQGVTPYAFTDDAEPAAQKIIKEWMPRMIDLELGRL